MNNENDACKESTGKMCNICYGVIYKDEKIVNYKGNSVHDFCNETIKTVPLKSKYICPNFIRRTSGADYTGIKCNQYKGARFDKILGGDYWQYWKPIERELQIKHYCFSDYKNCPVYNNHSMSQPHYSYRKIEDNPNNSL